MKTDTTVWNYQEEDEPFQVEILDLDMSTGPRACLIIRSGPDKLSIYVASRVELVLLGVKIVTEASKQ